MATKTNLKEVGWIYHAPPKKEVRPEVYAPPPSQIPMLGIQEELPPQEIKEMIFKSTDTPYIMLAKQNGRPDLLRFKEWKPDDVINAQQKKVSQQGQQGRCDWFYLEDNALEDATKKGQQDPAEFAFTRPDYMVHQAFNPQNLKSKELYSHYPGKPVRRAAPYATDDNLSEEEQEQVMDGIDDNRRPFGYGIRQAKQKAADERKHGGRKDASQLPAAGVSTQHSDNKSSGIVKADEAVNMSKLLANSYASETETLATHKSAQVKGSPVKNAPRQVKGQKPVPVRS